ncbi:MAG: septum formation family protein, partial [Nocardioidaceae bacterium]|nr:septum formation family protein [Nocardioidaceae bacterium]
CSKKHNWRAVSAVKIGAPDDPYPGDQVMESRTNAFCKSAVKAWLNYPSSFQYGYTYFHKPEWEFGVRRSVCWAKTNK